jgi:hypothetical protein
LIALTGERAGFFGAQGTTSNLEQSTQFTGEESQVKFSGEFS